MGAGDMGAISGPVDAGAVQDSIRHAVSEAEALLREVTAVLRRDPGLDPETVRHTLALLRLDPLTRLNRSLLRGRAAAIHRT